jgi:uncharacterized protein YyaL (SSP411 family)
MITACCKAYAATGEALYIDMATRSIEFLETNLRDNSGNWLHTWKSNQSKYKAFWMTMLF